MKAHAWMIGLAALACGKSAPQAVVATHAEALVVTRGTLEDRITLTGEIEARTSENLTVPRTPTWLVAVRWLAEDGSTAKKGDRVVEFDSSSFTATLEDKRVAVVRAGSELASASAAAEAADADKAMEAERKRADLAKAEVEAGVPPELYPRRLFQEKQMDLSRARDAKAKADDEQRTQRRTGRLDRDMKKLALTRAERELAELGEHMEELTLRAPRDGLVQISINRREGRKFLVGDQAFPGWSVAAMPDMGAMQVRARLMDVDDGSVAAGMRAESVLDAYPDKTWPGTVRELSPVARADGRDSTRRFFDVVVALDGTVPAYVRPGMSVRIEVVRRRANDALLVPRVALRSPAGKTRVHLQSGGDQEVTIDWCTEMVCVVRAGLVEGAVLSRAGSPERGPS